MMMDMDDFIARIERIKKELKKQEIDVATAVNELKAIYDRLDAIMDEVRRAYRRVEELVTGGPVYQIVSFASIRQLRESYNDAITQLEELKDTVYDMLIDLMDSGK